MEYAIRKIKNGWIVVFKSEIAWDEISAPTLEAALAEIAKHAETAK